MRNTVQSQRKYLRSLDISKKFSTLKNLNEIFTRLTSEDFVHKIRSPNCFASYEAYIFNKVYRFMVLEAPDPENLVCKTVLFPYTDSSFFSKPRPAVLMIGGSVQGGSFV